MSSDTPETTYTLSDLFDFQVRLTRELKTKSLKFVPSGHADQEWQAMSSIATRSLQSLQGKVLSFRNLIERAFNLERYRNDKNELVLFDTNTEIIKRDEGGIFSEVVTITLNKHSVLTLRIKDTGKEIKLSELQRSVQGELMQYLRQWSNPVKVFSVFCQRFADALN